MSYTYPVMIEDIQQWFRLAVPEPNERNRQVQIGCHFEEVSEMQEALRDPSEITAGELAWEYKRTLNWLDPNPDRIALLDSLCDQIVTAIGVAHMFGMDIQGALAEVNRSNWSKFVDGKPVFDANGKIAKPASYSKPDLKRFV